MGKRLPNTPRSRIKASLRKLSLRSRERAAAIKAANNTCERCHRKGSVAKGRVVKIEAHHKTGVLNWDEIYKVLYKYLLCKPDQFEILCKECHANHDHSQQGEPKVND